MSYFSRWIVARLLAAVAGVGMLGIIFSTAYEALGRRLGISFIGHLDLIQILIVYVIWAGIACAEIHQRHIRIETVISRLGPRKRVAFELVFTVVILIVCLIAILGSAKLTIYAWSNQIKFFLLEWPAWIAHAGVCLGFGGFAFLQIVRIKDLLEGRFESRKPGHGVKSDTKYIP